MTSRDKDLEAWGRYCVDHADTTKNLRHIRADLKRNFEQHDAQLNALTQSTAATVEGVRVEHRLGKPVKLEIDPGFFSGKTAEQVTVMITTVIRRSQHASLGLPADLG